MLFHLFVGVCTVARPSATDEWRIAPIGTAHSKKRKQNARRGIVPAGMVRGWSGSVQKHRPKMGNKMKQPKRMQSGSNDFNLHCSKATCANKSLYFSIYLKAEDLLPNQKKRI